jgi:hypothetical protein
LAENVKKIQKDCIKTFSTKDGDLFVFFVAFNYFLADA